MTPVLVTGTGRCRTAWAAQVLGITHQRISHVDANSFAIDGIVPRRVGHLDHDDLDASDSSFEAAPLAEGLAAHGWRIVLLVRDPAEVVRSWLSLGAFGLDMVKTHTDWFRSMRAWAPEAQHGRDAIDRAVRFYIRWNQLALLANPTILNVEKIGAYDLIEAAGRELSVSDRDPGVVDDGTPDRLPIVIEPTTRCAIRDRVKDYLPHWFDYGEHGMPLS